MADEEPTASGHQGADVPWYLRSVAHPVPPDGPALPPSAGPTSPVGDPPFLASASIPLPMPSTVPGPVTPSTASPGGGDGASGTTAIAAPVTAILAPLTQDGPVEPGRREQPSPFPAVVAPGSVSGRRSRAPLGLYGTVAVSSFVVAALAAVALLLGIPSDGDMPTDIGARSASPVAEDAGTVPQVPAEDANTSPDETSPPATPSETEPANGDLGLSVPISSPACDSSWVVFLGAATDANTYAADVSVLLDSQPGAMYTLTQGGCSSMRQQMPDGSLIYAVYLGPYPDQNAACAVRDQVGGVAYVKRMDDGTPADQLWQC